eukprot:4896447-Pleurochrysis_carterae.AAC.1
MVSIIVATGTTLNIAADQTHPIGSWGISHISLNQRIPLKTSVRDPFAGSKRVFCIIIVPIALIPYLGLTNISRVENPNAVDDIAIP